MAAERLQQQPQCHIFTYESPWKVYALGYSWRQDQPFRFGLGSFLEDKTNKVRVLFCWTILILPRWRSSSSLKSPSRSCNARSSTTSTRRRSSCGSPTA